MRTDVHKPSSINPSDYQYVGQECIKVEGLGDCLDLKMMRERIQAHMQKTGGIYSQHSHGGNCMVCGNANAIYTILFYHANSNTYVRMGQDCAEKCAMSYRDGVEFRRAVGNARKALAGKKKAQALLDDMGMSEAWEIFDTYDHKKDNKYEENKIFGLVNNLVRYGSFTERQEPFLQNLLQQLKDRPAKDAQRAEERENAENCPEGSVTISGIVIKTDVAYNAYGSRYVMAVKDTRGFVVWGTLPRFLSDAKKGDSVTFQATVTPSPKDEKFGFYKRPKK